ncbi:MAG TPA: phosphatidylserine decarboxylase [Planctomycetota bacterium]|nr:phosphatidylserine decarboxylase [Planctomycetota bacterium]
MKPGWPDDVHGVQPGGGPVAALAQAFGRWRRAWLRALRPAVAARRAAQRLGSCPGCTHDVLDGRDLLWVRNVCGHDVPGPLRVDPFRDRFGLVRLGRADVLACLMLGGAAAFALAFVQPWFAPAPLLLPLFAVWFFRDPDRISPRGPALVLAPADGVLDDVRHEAQCAFFDGPAWRLGIYLSLLDVHVNRAPVAGRAESFEYRRGRRLPTKRRGCTDGNEQLLTWFRLDGGGTVVVRQIAGPAARRICNVLRSGERVAAGQRFGLIKFGSRTEVWVPADGVQLAARPGDRVRGGESVLALLAISRAAAVDAQLVEVQQR